VTSQHNIITDLIAFSVYCKLRYKCSKMAEGGTHCGSTKHTEHDQ